MDLPAEARVEQVRRILSSRNLTLYRVSEQSAEIFGRSSPFYVPHNLYYDLSDHSLIPTFHQILALSHITGYELRDWFVAFGFDLELIPRLRLLIPRSHTTLLDSSVYDSHAWIPWIADRHPAVLPSAITPLTQLLRPAPPMRALNLPGGGKGKFLYGKVGAGDLYAIPYLAPGSIVRIDPARSEEASPAFRNHTDRQLFFVEYDSGCTCSRLAMLAKDRIVLHSPELPCTQIELTLGRNARILGRLDAEIRPLVGHGSTILTQRSTSLRNPRSLGSYSVKDDLKNLLQRSRLRTGMSFREASSMSRWIANLLSDDSYFAATSTLSDYETLSDPPRHIQKAITLCVLYSIDFLEFLGRSGLPLEQAGHQWMPDELIRRQAPAGEPNPTAPREGQFFSDGKGYLSLLIEQWQEIPLFLRHSMDELTNLKKLSLSDVFWVGGDNAPIHPWLVGASLIAVNRRIKRPSQTRAISDQPLYLILKRDGNYLCGCCALDHGELVVPAYPGVPLGALRFRNGIDAEVVGQVTTILRHLD